MHRFFRELFPAAAAILAGCALLAAGQHNAGFAEWYRAHVYRGISVVFSRVSGMLPFSAAEIGLYVLGVLAAAGLVRCLFGGAARGRLFRGYGLFLLHTVSALWLLFAANCGVNYYARAFSEEAGLAGGSVSTEALRGLSAYLVSGIRQADGEILSLCPDAEDPAAAKDGRVPLIFAMGQTEETPAADRSYLRESGEICRKAMRRLGETYPDLAGWYPMPKPVLVSRILTVQQTTGVYSPFTVEANVNREIPLYNIPFTMCHELSHLRGFMREDEANFIAFLALMDEDNPGIRRSALLEGWVYAGNALAAADPSYFAELYGQLSDADRRDLDYNNRFWDAFRGKAAETHEKVNNAYLRANGQAEGTKSYGRMVDLMIVWYSRNH